MILCLSASKMFTSPPFCKEFEESERDKMGGGGGERGRDRGERKGGGGGKERGRDRGERKGGGEERGRDRGERKGGKERGRDRGERKGGRREGGWGERGERERGGGGGGGVGRERETEREEQVSLIINAEFVKHTPYHQFATTNSTLNPSQEQRSSVLSTWLLLVWRD